MTDKRNIVCINFRRFATFEDFQDWTLLPEAYEYINININEIKGAYIDFGKIFNRVDKLWVIDKYIIAHKNSGSDDIIINPDINRYLLEESFDITKVNEVKDETKNVFITNEDMTVDSILDKINEVGFKNLTDVEREFLERNC